MMEQIYKHIEAIAALAESQEGMFETEVTVLVRRDGGQKSDFIRMLLDQSDNTRKTRQLTIREYRGI